MQLRMSLHVVSIPFPKVEFPYLQGESLKFASLDAIETNLDFGIVFKPSFVSDALFDESRFSFSSIENLNTLINAKTRPGVHNPLYVLVKEVFPVEDALYATPVQRCIYTIQPSILTNTLALSENTWYDSKYGFYNTLERLGFNSLKAWYETFKQEARDITVARNSLPVFSEQGLFLSPGNSCREMG